MRKASHHLDVLQEPIEKLVQNSFGGCKGNTLLPTSQCAHNAVTLTLFDKLGLHQPNRSASQFEPVLLRPICSQKPRSRQQESVSARVNHCPGQTSQSLGVSCSPTLQSSSQVTTQ